VDVDLGSDFALCFDLRSCSGYSLVLLDLQLVNV
jgi:hypothetical protein